MTARYAITGYAWGYNDETFFKEGGFVHALYDSEAAARADMAGLERAAWEQMDIAETDVFFDGPDIPEENLEKMAQILRDSLDATLDEANEYPDLFVSPELSDEELLTMVELGGFNAYKLVRLEASLDVFVLWDPEERTYLRTTENDAVVMADSVEEIKRLADGEFSPLGWLFGDEAPGLSGTFEDLSDTPKLLEQLIASNNALEYVDGRIEVTSCEADALIPLNELLKKPKFEIKRLTLDEFEALSSDSR